MDVQQPPDSCLTPHSAIGCIFASRSVASNREQKGFERRVVTFFFLPIAKKRPRGRGGVVGLSPRRWPRSLFYLSPLALKNSSSRSPDPIVRDICDGPGVRMGAVRHSESSRRSRGGVTQKNVFFSQFEVFCSSFEIERAELSEPSSIDFTLFFPSLESLCLSSFFVFSLSFCLFLSPPLCPCFNVPGRARRPRDGVDTGYRARDGPRAGLGGSR